MRTTSSGEERRRSKVVWPTYEVSRRPWPVPRLGAGWLRYWATADSAGAALSAEAEGAIDLLRASSSPCGADSSRL